jgi:hypothetical protein
LKTTPATTVSCKILIIKLLFPSVDKVPI